MQSIVSYKERGNYGNAKYRGNCSGYIIKDLIEHFYPKSSKPKKFIEVFSGGGTGKDVAEELNIKNSLHLDLNNRMGCFSGRNSIRCRFCFFTSAILGYHQI